MFELASRLGFPVLTLVDTQGAHPGLSSEQHGQAGAIARSMLAMARLDVPSVAVVIGEGGSGGALAIAVADRVLMMENAIYSVISPEGGAAILWRDCGSASQGRGRIQADRALLPRARRDRRRRPRALGRCEQGSRSSRADARRQRSRHAFETIEDEPAALRRHRRRARFRELGVWLETTITDDPDDEDDEDDDAIVALEQR